MIYVLTILHLLCCLVLILVVLLQTGKRADLAGAFGGGGSQTAFGTRGAATLLSKLTTGFAVMFMFTSIGLSILAARSAGDSGSALEAVPGDEAEQVQIPADESAPAELPPLPADPGEGDTNTEEAPAELPTE